MAIIFFALSLPSYSQKLQFSSPITTDLPPTNQHKAQITTVSVMKDEGGKSSFAVGSQKIMLSNYDEMAEKVALLGCPARPVDGSYAASHNVSYTEPVPSHNPKN